MRRFFVLVRTGAAAALAEPLSPVLFLTALLAVHLLPVFHYHQFGEAGRLARECGFSALLVFGLVFATSAAFRAVGNEISSGTAAMALTRSVPRALFFCGKICGVFAAFILFLFAVASATLLSSGSSELGARLALEHGVAPVWGPGAAGGILFTLFAFAGAAAANRFARVRFCAGACLALTFAQPLALGVARLAGGSDFVCEMRLIPVFLILAPSCCAFIACAGALAVRLRPAPVTALVSSAVLLSFLLPWLSVHFPASAALRAILPDIGCFWRADDLAGGGIVSFREAVTAVTAGIALTLFWLVSGAALFERKEIS